MYCVMLLQVFSPLNKWQLGYHDNELGHITLIMRGAALHGTCSNKDGALSSYQIHWLYCDGKVLFCIHRRPHVGCPCGLTEHRLVISPTEGVIGTQTHSQWHGNPKLKPVTQDQAREGQTVATLGPLMLKEHSDVFRPQLSSSQPSIQQLIAHQKSDSWAGKLRNVWKNNTHT